MTRTITLRGAALCLAGLACLLPLPALAQGGPPPVPPEEPRGPPPIPPDTTVAYYVVEGDAAAGPFTMVQLQGRVAAGTLRANTKVWADGMDDWVEASRVDALKGLFDIAPVPEQTADYSGFILGSWETTGPVTFGQNSGMDRTVLTFKSDSSFELFSQGNFNSLQGPFETRTSGQGTYTVHTLSEGRFELRLKGTQTLEIIGYNTGGQVSDYSPVIQVSIIDQNSISSGPGKVTRRLGF